MNTHTHTKKIYAVYSEDVNDDLPYHKLLQKFYENNFNDNDALHFE